MSGLLHRPQWLHLILPRELISRLPVAGKINQTSLELDGLLQVLSGRAESPLMQIPTYLFSSRPLSLSYGFLLMVPLFPNHVRYITTGLHMVTVFPNLDPHLEKEAEESIGR